jgi:hypothetical protein
VLVVGLITLGLALSATETIGENGTSQRSFAWGAYRVTVWQYANADLADVAQVRAPGGEVLLDVRGTGLLRSGVKSLEDFTGDGVPELHLMGWTGGAYCCYTDLLFQRTPQGVRNILIFGGREYHLHKTLNGAQSPMRDLDGDGRAELTVENDAIAHVNGSTHGATSVLILRWNGARFVAATQKFPALARVRAFEYRSAVLRKTDFQGVGGSDLLAGYYANAVLAGETQAARTWLRAAGYGAWLLETQAEIEAALRWKRVWVNPARLQRVTFAPRGR